MKYKIHANFIIISVLFQLKEGNEIDMHLNRWLFPWKLINKWFQMGDSKQTNKQTSVLWRTKWIKLSYFWWTCYINSLCQLKDKFMECMVFNYHSMLINVFIRTLWPNDGKKILLWKSLKLVVKTCSVVNRRQFLFHGRWTCVCVCVCGKGKKLFALN